MHKRWIALLLALLLMMPAGCRREEEQKPASSEASASTQQSDVSAAVELPPEEPLGPTSEEMGLLADYTEQPVAWGTGIPLGADKMPDNYNGLELPVQGATGYTSIAMPLWAEIEDAENAAIAVEEWEGAQEQAAQQPVSQSSTDNQLSNTSQALAAGSAQTGNPSTVSAVSLLSMSGNTAVAVRLSAQTETGEEMPAAGEPAAPGDASSPQGESSGSGTQAPADPAAPPETTDPSSSAGAPAEPGTASPEVPTPPDQSNPGEAVPEEPVEEVVVPTLADGSLTTLPSGTAFTILQEQDEWWQIEVEADYELEGEMEHGVLTGWVQHLYCMINLPDVIPSIIYDATNSYSSRFVSCGKVISGVTAQALYPSATYNQRLGEKEYMMPVLYSMAFKLYQAQQAALAEGNTLILYEGYRPHEIQTKVLNALSALTKKDAEVKQAVTGAPWQISWFISGGYSNHQRGYAVDVGVARVVDVKECYTGGYRYIRVTGYELYSMPSPIHELSRAAATFTKPVAINSTTAWKSAELAPTMNAPALGLQRYCTGAQLTPLASEWWHFNDLDTREKVLDNQGIGDFYITENRSVAP